MMARIFSSFFLAVLLALGPASGADVVIADAVRCVHGEEPGSVEVIVDDSSPEFFKIGSWQPGVFSGGYLDSYLWSTASDTSPSSAYWLVGIPTAGTYEVAVWYPAGSNRLPDVDYWVQHAGGITRVTLDQTVGGDWERLGEFYFEAGQHIIGLSSRLSDDVFGDIIVDDGDPLFHREGSWITGTYSPGYEDDYFYAGCSSVASATACWEFPIFVAGNYEILAWFTPGSNRNERSLYRIECGAGVRERLLDQTAGESGWHSLGRYPFLPGRYTVTLSNQGPAGKVVIADAACASYCSTQGPLPAVINILFDTIPTPSAGEPIALRAEVLSASPLSGVQAEHWVSGETIQASALYDDGLHEDGAAGDSIYGGWLSGAPSQSVINYRVEAASINGATAVSETYKCLVAYDSFTQPELRMVFMYGLLTPEDVDSGLARVRAGHFNAVCNGVRSVADAAYQSSYEPWMAGIPEGFDPLEYLVEQAHDTSDGKAYIQVHPLVLVYRVLTSATPPAGHVLDLHPEWTSENYAGETFIVDRMYMDQGVPEVQDYLINVFMEIINNYDIDGFNLDFIRYREQNVGYNPIALDYFHQFRGRSDRPPIDDPEWCDWRREQVTSLVKRVYANILKVKPHVLLTVDGVCWGAAESTPEANRFYWYTFQDWPGWLANHYIDGVLGMAYRNESVPALAAQFDQWQAFLRNHRGDREASVIVGGYQNLVQHSLVQLHRVRQSGSPWLSVFSDSSTNTQGAPREEFYAAVASQLFPTPVSPPEYDWKTDRTTGVVMGRVFDGDRPHRRGRMTLGEPLETRTDLCGFYVFFDVEPGAYNLTVYNQDDQAIYTTTLSVSAASVTERDILLTSSIPTSYWRLH